MYDWTANLQMLHAFCAWAGPESEYFAHAPRRFFHLARPIYAIKQQAVVPVLVFFFVVVVALWFILRGDLFYVLLCVILFLRFFQSF